MAIYLKFDGIKGNVTADGFKDHIAILSVKFSASRTISMEAGNLSNRESSRPTISEVTLTKTADSSVAALFKEAVTGSAGKTALIKFVRTGTNKVQEYMEYSLENCLVSGYQIQAEADAEPMETLTLSFSKVMINYHDHDASNKSGSPQRVGYDLEKAKPL